MAKCVSPPRAAIAVHLTVADTGMGIAADDAPQIFKRFYRADKSRTASTGNSGLGLAICKSIVTAHGGTLISPANRTRHRFSPCACPPLER